MWNIGHTNWHSNILSNFIRFIWNFTRELEVRASRPHHFTWQTLRLKSQRRNLGQNRVIVDAIIMSIYMLLNCYFLLNLIYLLNTIYI